MKRISCILFLCLIMFAAIAQKIDNRTERKLVSPDGKYTYTFYQKSYGHGNSRLLYSVEYAGETVISESELGVEIENRLLELALGMRNDTCSFWGENLEIISTDTFNIRHSWYPLYGEYDILTDNYNAMTVALRKGNDTDATVQNGYDKRQYYYMKVEIRAYNEGIAFRYYFPEATNGLFLHITGERSSFTLPSETKAWHTGWAQGPYAVTALKDWRGESERPLLLQLPSGLYVSLGEARMIDYARGKFDVLPLTAMNKADNSRTIGVSLYSPVNVATPYATPWRIIMASKRATDLINNKQIYLNLNDECRISDTSFIHPGKVFRVCHLTREDIIKGIDFASRRGLQYIELDAGWYGPEAKMSSDATKVADTYDFDIADVCQKAREKGIGVWLYVNQRALYAQLDSILPLYKRWGVAGIKFGFVHIGSQYWSVWLHEAVRQCAEYGLMVDIHDEYRPTGFSRTYPNLLTQEGVGGNEEMPDADHNTILPFTRFLCGPADYTLCYFDKRVRNTKAHQLAMAVVYYSPLQFMYWYDSPSDYKGESEMKFWRDVPAVWNDSKAVDGKPGEYIVQVRRSGNDWFLGAMTNTKGRVLTINTADFLPLKGKFDAEIYNDDPSLNTRTNVRSSVMKNVKNGRKIKLKLQPNGGAAIRFIAK